MGFSGMNDHSKKKVQDDKKAQEFIIIYFGRLGIYKSRPCSNQSTRGLNSFDIKPCQALETQVRLSGCISVHVSNHRLFHK